MPRPALLICFCLLTLGTTSIVQATSWPPRTLGERVEAATLIVVGKVISIKTVAGPNSSAHEEAIVQVSQVLKNDTAGRLLAVGDTVAVHQPPAKCDRCPPRLLGGAPERGPRVRVVIAG